MSKFDERGRELPDPTPVAMPVGFQIEPSISELIKRYVRDEVSRAAAQDGEETFEEADDFDVGDDFDPNSPWELSADQEAKDPAKAPWQAQAERNGWQAPKPRSWVDDAVEAGWSPPQAPPPQSGINGAAPPPPPPSAGGS